MYNKYCIIMSLRRSATGPVIVKLTTRGRSSKIEIVALSSWVCVNIGQPRAETTKMSRNAWKLKEQGHKNR